jgi:hypothetical protein
VGYNTRQRALGFPVMINKKTAPENFLRRKIKSALDFPARDEEVALSSPRGHEPTCLVLVRTVKKHGADPILLFEISAHN